MAIVNLERVDQGKYVRLIVDCCLHYGFSYGVPVSGGVFPAGVREMVSSGGVA
jgi:hypothetical protein